METAQTADHALRILMTLGEDGPATAADLTRRLGLARSVLQRLTSTLLVRGFVTRDARGVFAIGPAVVELARAARPGLAVVAGPILARLTATTGETAILSVRTGDDARVEAASVSERHLVQVAFAIGYRHPLVRGAPGKAILLACAPSVREGIVARAEDPEAVRQSLEDAERSGVLVTLDELGEGLHGIAMPVVAGATEASVAIAVPSVRASGMLEHIPALRAAIRDIERETTRPPAGR